MAQERRGRRGGGAARRQRRSEVAVEAAPVIENALPRIEILDEDALAAIEAAAETVLEEVGIEFPENPAALERWREAGADVRESRVRIPRGLARELIRTAPSTFTQHARNPARSVEIGGRKTVFAPVYGPPFVRDLEGERRYGTIEDFRNFVRLGQMTPWLHHSGGTLCEPTDIPVSKRHLDMLMAHITLSDRPFMGAVTAPERAADAVEMAKILFGEGFVAENVVLLSLVNLNSPLVFDATMAGVLEVYARAGQACIVSPFIVGGAMSPVTEAGTLVQILAEVLAAVAYSQLIRKGAPVIFGAFVTSIDMGSGAPTFGTPEASRILWGAGQLARRLGLPFRSGGALTGAKLPDAQAGYESANTLQAAMLGGVNFMLHGCGWLEGGLVASFEKFVLDADQLGALHTLAAPMKIDADTLALEAVREVGPGGHYLGCAHTQSHFRTAFWRSEVFDTNPYETWSEAGAPDAARLANERARKMLAAYEAPPLDSAIREALEDFVERRKAELPDSFS